MQSHIARFKQMKPLSQTFLDSRIPGHEKDIYSVIGANVQQDPGNVTPAIQPDGFNVAYAGAESGNGAALHDHETVEVFIPMSGSWLISWGDAGEHETVLEQWDCFAVPPGVMRAFKNIGDDYAVIMAITGGTDAGKITWAQQVVAQAEKTGLRMDKDGNLIDTEMAGAVD